jgi:CspA family cold shock protein
MQTGKVKWFDEKKGWGWIIRDDKQPDIFVHISAIRYGSKNLKTGDAVGFEIEHGTRGPKAVHVRLANQTA